MATQSFRLGSLGRTARASLATMLKTVTARSTSQRKRAALIEQHRLHFDLMCKAMDDPALTAVLDTYDAEIPLDKQRQFLFANVLYVNALFYHRIGAWTRPELFGHLRILCQNPVFREYWEATRPHRMSLPRESEEAVLGNRMDDLIRELDDSDGEEWWVVGTDDG
ncbi:hypothetical protein Stsp02_73610 [Streptomyces sp. NBRC 14336]|uniref:DUF6082 family protein n=1 Tax=Streptomyces sp. NBRC 14336 TaxID=3030992 RepID=UPI0024A497E8|nr:DUF6082 family protein [Streptomyces sp. NBRC 14336]GLW51700.1 hypothetical protein Stsp02_73610 [Streptomyces sp. NBRC 14336]